MIVKINGCAIPNKVVEVIRPITVQDVLNYIDETKMTKKDAKKLQKLCVWLWSVSGMMFSRSAFAAGTQATQVMSNGDLWTQMLPVFGMFKEFAMVLGAFALIGGLITMIFKKRLGIKIISTAGIVIGGVFLVPAAVMLAAIVGEMIGSALEHAFSNLRIQNSVPTSPIIR